MKTIKIYQTKQGVPYSFMNWEYTSKKDFNLTRDYDVVAKYEMAQCGKTIDEMLEKIFYYGNNGTLQKDFYMRSVSVSDVISIDGDLYFVDSLGFKKIA